MKVKVIEIPMEKMMNLWGGYDDLTPLIGETGTIVSTIYPDSNFKKHGIEFDNWFPQSIRERTGVIFSIDQLEIINEQSEDVVRQTETE